MVDIRNEQITILNNRVRELEQELAKYQGLATYDSILIGKREAWNKVKELEQELADLKRKNGVLEATNCHHDPHYCNQLEKELAAREEDITKLGETIDGYREREAGLEKELAELKESKKKDVSWMNEQIEKLTADSEKWFGKYTVETGRRDKALAIISEEFHHADSHLVEGEYVEVMRVLKRVRGVLSSDIPPVMDTRIEDALAIIEERPPVEVMFGEDDGFWLSSKIDRIRGVLEPDPAKNVKTVKDDGV